jgi:hypothetical protein
MPVSMEEQEGRRKRAGQWVMAVIFSAPLFGDLLGIFFLAIPLYTQTFVKSKNRMVDFVILTGLTVLFFPLSYVWFFVIHDSYWNWKFAVGTRFAILGWGLPWYYSRLDDGGFYQSWS